MGNIVKNFNEFHDLNEAKKITIDVDYACQDSPEECDKWNRQHKVSIEFGKGAQAFVTGSKKDLKRWLEDSGYEDLEELYPEVFEAKATVSKVLLKAIDKHHAAQLGVQKITKEFLSTPKEDVAKREKIKVKLIAANKEAKSAEAEFQATLGKEEADDIEIIW